jgi:transcriptional regulator with XRE-family HTH domain
MASVDLRAEEAGGGIGRLLREWRLGRRRSQLDLALDAGVSPRHLSYVETGKSRPSASLVEQLAETLDIPLRERNALLLAAGHAPRYRETSLEAAELERSRQAIDLILDHHNPFPAFVVNRYWDVLIANRGLERLFGRLLGRPPRHMNILHQIFDPDDVRPLIAGWEDLAGDLLRHVHVDVANLPTDLRLRLLLDEILSYPGAPQSWRSSGAGAGPLPTIETRFRYGSSELRFFSTMTTFAGARDVTLSELRIESMFPADEGTAAFCRAD